MLKRSCLLAAAAALSLGACTTTSSSQSIDPMQRKAPQWSIVQSADNSRASAHAEGSFAYTDGKLVLLGGRGRPRTDIFDLATCTWSQGQAAPFQIHHFQAVAKDGLVYVIGAFTGGYPAETPVSRVMIYDIAADSWREGPVIPEDRRRGATAAVQMDDWIFVMGGAQNGHIGGHVAWTDRFNIVTGEWERLPDAPRPRDHTAAALIDGKIILAGGRLSKAPENTFNLTIRKVDIFDLETQSWTTNDRNLPSPRAGLAAVALDDGAYFLGGESASQSTAHREVEGFAADGSAMRLPRMPEGSHGFGAATRRENGSLVIYTTGGVITRGGGPQWTDLARFGAEGGACPAS